MEDFFPDDNTELEEEISFFSEISGFSPPNKPALDKWLRILISKEGKKLKSLTYIFLSDEQLLEINRQYLRHDTFTDIITFPYSPLPLIHGDIFISVERVTANAEKFDVSFEEELSRVMSHGLLHLCGYGDKTESEKVVMKRKEDESMEVLKSFHD